MRKKWPLKYALVAMGSITLEDTAGKTLDLSCNMGSVDLDDIDYQQLTLEADAGSIEGTLAGAQADYTVTCSLSIPEPPHTWLRGSEASANALPSA